MREGFIHCTDGERNVIGEIGLRDWWRVISAGVHCGACPSVPILGTIGFLRIALWSLFGDVYGPHWLLVALTVAISLVGVVMWGSPEWFAVTVYFATVGFRPAGLVCSFCRDDCRCDGTGALF